MHEGLLGLENVVLAPHLGSATRDTRIAMGMLCVDALRAVLLEGRTPANVVVRLAFPLVANYGSQAMWGDLERVLVRPPLPADTDHIARYGWRGVPDVAAAAAEHEELRALLEAAGAEVIVSEHDPGNPDAIYVYDPVLVGDEGAALLRPGKEGRLGEPAGIGQSLEAAGVPIASTMAAPATVEGGDTVWLDHDTLLVGHGYRTGTAGIAALREAFPDVEVIAFDLPHWVGASEVMHLMSLISPLDSDLALVYPRIAPVRLMELARRPRDRSRRGSRRGVRVDGLERPRTRAASCARPRGERRHPSPHGAGRRRRRHVPRRPHLAAR